MDKGFPLWPILADEKCVLLWDFVFKSKNYVNFQQCQTFDLVVGFDLYPVQVQTQTPPEPD